eukprot:351034-Chlamydomonas_euryale.AAC.2
MEVGQSEHRGGSDRSSCPFYVSEKTRRPCRRREKEDWEGEQHDRAFAQANRCRTTAARLALCPGRVMQNNGRASCLASQDTGRP